MPAELPVACSLRASELSTRLAEIASLGNAALLDARQNRGRAELRFASRAGVRERVDRIVVAESKCCAFLIMSVEDEPGAVILTIEAPAGGEPVLTQLVEAFRGQAQIAR